MNTRRNRALSLLLTLALALSLAGVVGCSGGNAKAPVDKPVAVAPTFDASEAMIEAANGYLLSEPVPTISAEDLYNNVVLAGDPNYQIVSVRAPEHYAAGHIKGAINIPFKTIYEEENLAKLDPDKKIVVVCYTGHTASEATMFYNMLGYDATTLKFGMAGWTTDKAVYGLTPFPTGKAAGYETSTEPVEATGTYDLPVIDGDYKDARAAILAQAEKYFASELPFTIEPKDVYDKVVLAKDPSYQLLSVRTAEDYAKGHVPGAINVPWTKMGDKEMLSKLDPNKTTVVYCYTGHTGGQISMFLNLMGYPTVNMKFGMSGWNSDPAVGGVVGYVPATVKDLPVVSE